MMITVPELIGIDYTGGNPLLDVTRGVAGLAGLAGPFDVVEGTARVVGNILSNPKAIVEGIKYTLPGKATTPREKMVNETKILGWLGFGAALYFLPGWWKILALPAGFIVAGMDAYGKMDDIDKLREVERAQYEAQYGGQYATQELYVGPTTPTIAQNWTAAELAAARQVTQSAL